MQSLGLSLLQLLDAFGEVIRSTEAHLSLVDETFSDWEQAIALCWQANRLSRASFITKEKGNYGELHAITLWYTSSEQEFLLWRSVRKKLEGSTSLFWLEFVNHQGRLSYVSFNKSTYYIYPS